jgi:tubulin--tyrosine ligase
MWALFTNNKVWLYKEGYVRTSCKEFNLKNTDKFIHLTNDAVQKYSTDYGKY